MRVFKVNEKYLTMMGLLPDKPADSKWLKTLKRINYLILLFGIIYTLLLSSIVFIIQNRNEIEKITNSILVLTAGLTLCSGFLSYTWKRKMIQWVHKEFQNIVDQNKQNEFYIEAERKGRYYSKMIFESTIISTSVGAFAMAIGNAIYNIVRRNMNPCDWYLQNQTE